MPTRNVNLTDELDHFVLKKVKSGRYENASEVVRAALRTLEREEKQYEVKLAALRKVTCLLASGNNSTFRQRRARPWPPSISRVEPKPTCSASALIPFRPGAKSRLSVTSTIFKS